MEFTNIFSKKMEHTKSISESLTYDYDFENVILENIMLSDEEFYVIMKEHTYAMYTGIKSNNCSILEEGFKEVMNGAAKFFKNMIDRIIEFFKKAFTFFNSYIGDFEKFISKNKDVLGKLEPDFDIEAFEYTINDRIPNTDRIQDIISTYNRDLGNIRSMTYGDLLDEQQAFMTKSNLNKIRGEVIGIRGEINEETYLSRIKEVFRNNANSPENIHVNKSILTNTITSYSKLKQTLQKTKGDQAKIVGMLNNIKRFFDSGPNVHYSGSTKMVGTRNLDVSDDKVNPGELQQTKYEYDQLKILNLFFSYKFKQSQLLSVMITNVYFEKIRAIEEALKTYRKIIRNSLFDSGKDSKDEKGDKK